MSATYRRCRGCGQTKELSTRFFAHCPGVLGFFDTCKACTGEDGSPVPRRSPGPRPGRQPVGIRRTEASPSVQEIIHHACKKCGVRKPVTREFYPQLSGSTRFRLSCRQCMNAYNREHSKQNPSLAKARLDKRNNAERKVGLLAQARRRELKISLNAQQRGRCFYCGNFYEKFGELDHKFPINRGGTNELSNFVLACRTCNRDKHDKTPEEFREWRRQRGLSIVF